PIEVVYQAVDELSRLEPDYISVTYGAGGGAATAANTVEIASLVRNRYGIESVAHLPGINLTRDEVVSLLHRLRAHRIENILVLRGDRTPGVQQTGQFAHASDLAAWVTAQPGTPFNIIGACYPETHPEAASPAADLRALCLKVESGVTQLITQLFFDNDLFWAFLDRARHAGIDVPIQAGIMPVTNVRQVQRMLSLCGASQPPAFRDMIARHGDDDASLHDAGIDYAITQIARLVESGVDGIHLYTMNNPRTAAAITAAIYPLIR
ncbi:MAG: methylenetetrahydrofolate reductase, partial [Actinomycetes bacterium]|nr:methylenetetrahydrofolate reductase [Actinomycetes bacterium]